MEKLFKQLIESVKKDRKSLIRLKNVLVQNGQIELAAELRAIENKSFPDTEEIKEAKETSDKLNLLFRMVELDVPPSTCWLINETLKIHNKKGGKFSLMDSSKLLDKRNEIFLID